ncbi:hypothetical protein sscle_03g023980 [Sclerotinia sclerotiorum 1980 UF-70]|uniref:Uncharacterized protein n=1 Tax=Sclerotinia sclerotiorum (strain ATCC 18683 / 1980 / Ss-1) TaxID=665079 RepID=A0A1D9PY35_SCLS1|nr:hypothetical protein sscle_03g023980 [Sclerotinia sclerotiorum 1980 UF-70]
MDTNFSTAVLFWSTKRGELAAARKLRFPNSLPTLRIVSGKEAALLLFYAGIFYAGFYAIISVNALSIPRYIRLRKFGSRAYVSSNQ